MNSLQIDASKAALDDFGGELDDIEVSESPFVEPVLCQLNVPNGIRERLDRFLSHAVQDVSREKLKRVILNGGVRVEESICTEPKFKLHGGEHITVSLPAQHNELEPVQLDLKYIYKDTNLVVVNKPAGLTVHPCPSCDDPTLVHGLLWDLPEMRTMEGLRPGIVHRLDKDTSGVMVVALNESIRLKLSEAFAERLVQKTYLALVYGVPPIHGQCTDPIGRHPTLKIKMAVVKNGRPAHTEWDRLWHDAAGKYSLLSVRIHTGRTHQIRVHMAHCGFPLIGDSTYGNRRSCYDLSTERQMLHAWKLEIPDVYFPSSEIVSHETPASLMSFVIQPPEDIIEALKKAFCKPQRVVLTGCPGSGKSTVLKALTGQGAKTVSADALVHGLYEKDKPAWRVLKHKFGQQIIDPKNEQIDRKKLFNLMLNDDVTRNTVNRLVHPYVNEQLEQFWSTPSSCAVLVAEVPLWFEGNDIPDYPWPIKTICVNAEREHRHTRLLSNRGWDETMRATMDSWQLEDCEKCRLSDYVVHNNGSPEELNKEVDSVMNQLKAQFMEENTVFLQLLNSILEAK